MHMPVLLNAELYMLPSFTIESMLDAVVKYKILELYLVTRSLSASCTTPSS